MGVGERTIMLPLLLVALVCLGLSFTCTSGFKVSVTVLQLGNRPYITIFPHKHTYKIILRKHLETLTSSVHTHRNFDPRAQSYHHTNSTSVCLSENLSYEFIIISIFSSSFFDYEFHYNFSGRKQPSILHLLLFPMKQQHCLYPVCHRPLPPLISFRSFSFVPHASSDVQ